MVWTDSTTYSRLQKDRVQDSWTYQSNSIKITVTKGHIYFYGKWVMHCPQLNMDTVALKIDSSASPEEAQKLAVKMVKARLEYLSNSLADLHT